MQDFAAFRREQGFLTKDLVGGSLHELQSSGQLSSTVVRSWLVKISDAYLSLKVNLFRSPKPLSVQRTQTGEFLVDDETNFASSESTPQPTRGELLNYRPTVRDEHGRVLRRAAYSLNTSGRSLAALLAARGIGYAESLRTASAAQLMQTLAVNEQEALAYQAALSDDRLISLLNRSLSARISYQRNQQRMNELLGSTKDLLDGAAREELSAVFQHIYQQRYGSRRDLFKINTLRQQFLPLVTWYQNLPADRQPSAQAVEQLLRHGWLQPDSFSGLEATELGVLQQLVTKLRIHAPYTVHDGVVTLATGLSAVQVLEIIAAIHPLFPDGFVLDPLTDARYRDQILTDQQYVRLSDGRYQRTTVAGPAQLLVNNLRTTVKNRVDGWLDRLGQPIERGWVRVRGRAAAGWLEEKILGYRTGAITPARAREAFYQGVRTGLMWSAPTFLGDFGRAAYGLYRFGSNFYKNGATIFASISRNLQEAQSGQEKASILLVGVAGSLSTFSVQSISPEMYQLVMVLDTFNTTFVNMARAYQQANHLVSSGTFRVLEMIKNGNSFAYLVNGVNNAVGNAVTVYGEAQQVVVTNTDSVNVQYDTDEHLVVPTTEADQVVASEVVSDTVVEPVVAQPVVDNDPEPQTLNPAIIVSPGEALEFATMRPISIDNKLDAVVVPREIILHWDGQGASGGHYLGWTTNGTFVGLSGQITNAYTGLNQSLDAHFGVGVDGPVQFLPMYEQGVQYSYAASGYPDTINIEIAGFNFLRNGELFMKPDHFDHVVDLVKELAVTYDLPVDAIVGHHQRDLIQEMYYLNAAGEYINQYYFGETEELGRSLGATVVANYTDANGAYRSILVGPRPEIADRQPVDYEVRGELLNPATNLPFDKGKPDVGDPFLQMVKTEVAAELAQDGYVYADGQWVRQSEVVQEEATAFNDSDLAVFYQKDQDSVIDLLNLQLTLNSVPDGVSVSSYVKQSEWYRQWASEHGDTAKLDKALSMVDYGGYRGQEVQCVGYSILAAAAYPELNIQHIGGATVNGIPINFAKELVPDSVKSGQMRMASTEYGGIAIGKVSIEDFYPGDLFVLTNSYTGHVGVVIDVIVENGEKVVLIAEANKREDGVTRLSKVTAANFEQAFASSVYIIRSGKNSQFAGGN